MFSARKLLDRAMVLSAVVLGVWTLSASPSIAQPACALFCPFDTTLDAKKCRCVKNPGFTPINPCMLVCAPTWKLDAEKCRCIKTPGTRV
jgi:hypothetical protein